MHTQHTILLATTMNHAGAAAAAASPSFLEEQIQEASECLLTEHRKTRTTLATTQSQDDEEEYVRQLAASLAPAVEELDALLASPGMELAAHLDRLRQQRLAATKAITTRARATSSTAIPSTMMMMQPQKLIFENGTTMHSSGTGTTVPSTSTDANVNANANANAGLDDNASGSKNAVQDYSYDNEYDYESDGSFDDELQNLATSEQLLRQELEFAHDFGAMMQIATPMSILSKENKNNNNNNNNPTRPLQDPPQIIPIPFMQSLFDDDDDSDGHAREDRHQEQEHASQDSWISSTQDDHDDAHIAHETAEIQAEESFDDQGDQAADYYSLPVSQDPLHVDRQHEQHIETVPTTPPKRSATANPHTSASLTRHNYTLSDHSFYLKIQTENRGGWYYMPVLDLDHTVKEYIIPLPEKELDRLYVGFYGDDDADDPDSGTVPRGLPLRTIGIKIRPDVLVGAVMDAIMHALQDVCEVQKRQGGHLVLTTTNSSSKLLDLDFQLVSYKGTQGSRFCERTLILRIFYASNPSAQYTEHETSSSQMQSFDDEGDEGNADTSETASVKLKEAAALVQKMETSKQGASEKIFGSGFWGSKPVYPSKQAMQEAIALQLLKKYKPCPSVQDGHLTLPALSNDDWPWVLYSHKFIAAIWAEFQERDLSYASLDVCSFGQFPALTTLDVHYCSQLRRLSREAMVMSLLRSASELEQYAREAEYACANLIQVLNPCFELYKMDPPGLPQPLPLTSYPLDYTPHQDICPPWGQKVMEAMNGVTAISSDSSGDESFDRAEKAVQLVLDAFQRQHDEEQSARLGRKNMQVMDRLAKMQAHKQTSIDKLRQAYSKSAAAKKAADEFHRYAAKASSDLPETEQVPLFKCSILVGSSTGSVYVTATQIMCVTQFIPIVGGNTVVLLDLAGLEFMVQETATSLLNPLPAGISVRRGGAEVVLFRPSYAASRLVMFLEIVQALGGPQPKHYVGSSLRTQGVLDDEANVMDHMYGDTTPAES